MADIELIIKIDEKIYEARQHWVANPKRIVDEVDIAIANGKPLPKGHGDLKDADNLKHAFVMWSMAVQGNFTDADIASIIYNSPTIIEAESGDKK